ncbi:hypothetical protein KY290_018911 [Solanum tuberosum]|uniref:Uncharacterized protein n=1 Tax=Solanum tuberosum TaxID=4113 RepID=A0ABQ7VGB8_SOLTU|nr:hypothetical protein KY290_018911 [Solanum tuberosum]
MSAVLVYVGSSADHRENCKLSKTTLFRDASIQTSSSAEASPVKAVEHTKKQACWHLVSSTLVDDPAGQVSSVVPDIIQMISVSICFPVSEEGASMMSSAIRLAIAGSHWGFSPPALAVLTGILLFMVLDECEITLI